MHKIVYNSLNVDQIYPKFDTDISFRPPISVPNFSQIEVHMHIQVIVIFAKYAKRRKEKKSKEFSESLIAHISVMAKGVFFKFGMLPTLSGGHQYSTVNLVPFKSSIIEIWMHEITTLLVLSIYSLHLCTPHFLGLHNTLPVS